jgi:uncharacterized protein YfiM (DUF2279 family)
MRALALVFALSLHPGHSGRDRWLAPDKVKHFFLCAFIESVSYGALRAARVEHGTALGAAAGITLAAGAAKEVHDRHVAGDFSAKDLAWDAAGAAAAAVALDHTR